MSWQKQEIMYLEHKRKEIEKERKELEEELAELDEVLESLMGNDEDYIVDIDREFY